MSRHAQLFAELNAPYYVACPPFNVNSGGIRAMHTLCHALNLAGEEAYVVTDTVSPSLRTPSLTNQIVSRHRSQGREPIVIYPEVVKDNPMNARHVVRYLLNIPGFLSKEQYTWGSDDMIYAHGTDVVPPGMNATLLQIPLVDTGVFNTTGVDNSKRAGNLLFINRYLQFGGALSPVTNGFTEISFRVGARPREELARLYRSAQLLYTYEPSTACYEALMCGCPVVYLPNEIMLPKPMGNYLTSAGSAWGTSAEQIEKARRTVRDIPDIYEAINQTFWRELEAFVDTTQREVIERGRASQREAAAPKRVAVLSADAPSALAQATRFTEPFATLNPDWQLTWGVNGGEIRLNDIQQADLIILDRSTPGMLPIAAQEQLFQLGKPVVYATDEAFDATPESHPHAARRERWKAGIDYAARHAQVILVPTEQLAQAYRAKGCPVLVLPERIDFNRFHRAVRTTGAGVHIGVFGASLQRANFSLVTGALSNIQAEFGDRIKISLVGEALPDEWDLPAQFVPADDDYESYALCLRNLDLDIVLIPLQDDAFNNCGSPVRFFEYSAAGIACVTSDVAQYRSVIRDGYNGLLVTDNPGAWTAAITTLVTQPALRRQVARTAQAEVHKRHSLNAHREALQKTLTACLDPRTAPLGPDLHPKESTVQSVLVLDPDGDASKVEATLRDLRAGPHSELVAVVLTTRQEVVSGQVEQVRYVTTSVAEYPANVTKLSVLPTIDWTIITEAGEALPA